MEVCDKQEYETYKLAHDAAIEISKREKQSMHAYKCDKGDHWHMATAGKKRHIKTKYQNSYDAKIKFKSNNNKKIQNDSKQQSRELATEKLISPNMARMLKGLINAKNRLNNNGK